MATDLTAIFGYEINAHVQPRQADRQYVGFPGVHGVIGMLLGSRGRQLVISGSLAATGANYNAARIVLQAWIDDIEACLDAAPASYTYCGQTYDYIVFDRLQIVPDGQNKAFHFLSTGYVKCRFICYGMLLQ